MEKRTLGKTGEEVSILGFGCMRLPVLNPDDQTTIDTELATAMVRKAIDCGVNYLDTGWPYHRSGGVDTPGVSEPFLGKALRNGYRERVKIATKLPTWLVESRSQMDDILDQQMKRMEVKNIDFYLAHNLNKANWEKMKRLGMLPFLDEAIRDGRIRHAGFSFHDTYDVFEEVVGANDWSFCQLQFNYIDVDFQAGTRGLELASRRNMGVIVMEPLRGGFLANHLPEEATKMLADVHSDWTPAQWALRWLWSRSDVGMVLSGMSTMGQLEENLETAEHFSPLAAEEEAALVKVREYILGQIKVNCTACGYCLPCPQGVNIPKAFQFYNTFFRFGDAASLFQVRIGYKNMVPPEEQAYNCVSCGACDTQCPQAISISKEMPKVAEALKL